MIVFCMRLEVSIAFPRTGLLHFVQHQVHHHAGYADVEPDGQGPAGDGAVLVELRGEGAA